jgi:hypothetical protein
VIAEFDHPLWCRTMRSCRQLSVSVMRVACRGRRRGPMRSRARGSAFEDTLTWLAGHDAAGLAHDELEARLDVDAREPLRVLLQDHLDLRAEREVRVEQVACAEGVRRGCAEAEHRRRLATVFGEVGVSRIAYRARGRENLCPADALLNLPAEKHSHGLRRCHAGSDRQEHVAHRQRRR